MLWCIVVFAHEIFLCSLTISHTQSDLLQISKLSNIQNQVSVMPEPSETSHTVAELHHAVLTGAVTKTKSLLKYAKQNGLLKGWLASRQVANFPTKDWAIDKKNDGGGTIDVEAGLLHRAVVVELPEDIESGSGLDKKEIEKRIKEKTRQLEKNKLEIVELLLDYFVNVNARDSLERTALHWCICYGTAEIASALIDADAEVDCQDCAKNTPLFYAAANDYQVLMKVLTDNGADASILLQAVRNKFGTTKVVGQSWPNYNGQFAAANN